MYFFFRSKSTARAKQLPTLNLCNPRSENSRHSNKKASASYAFPHSMPGRVRLRFEFQFRFQPKEVLCPVPTD